MYDVALKIRKKCTRRLRKCNFRKPGHKPMELHGITNGLRLYATIYVYLCDV